MKNVCLQGSWCVGLTTGQMIPINSQQSTTYTSLYTS